MIQAKNVERARHFWSALPNGKIEPARDTPGMPGTDAIPYPAMNTGAAWKEMLDSGGLYRRYMNELVRDFVEVEIPVQWWGTWR